VSVPLSTARRVGSPATAPAIPSSAAPAISTEKDLAEGKTEVRVEDCVYDGVQQTVEVAQPADDADQ